MIRVFDAFRRLPTNWSSFEIISRKKIDRNDRVRQNNIFVEFVEHEIARRNVAVNYLIRAKILLKIIIKKKLTKDKQELELLEK